jgi:uncharacterized protein (TIGR02271 family)
VTHHTQDIAALRGQDLFGRDDEKLGTIEEVYTDADSGRPEWAVVTTGLFGTKQSFVPISDLRNEGDRVTVPYDKATVKDAPKIDPDGELSDSEERQLYSHYGRDYTGGDRNETVGHDTSGPTTDDAMTRSEEELRVGTSEREAGRARLRKYVVEEQVTQTVPVRREEVRVEREPITDANVDAATDGPEISEEEHEVVLHEEQPVAEKRVVPKERVRLDTEERTEQREVSETVRKEQVDLTTAPDAAGQRAARSRAARWIPPTQGTARSRRPRGGARSRRPRGRRCS